VKLLSPYKSLFEIAELKIRLNGNILKRDYRQSFRNIGPIDLILRLNDKLNHFSVDGSLMKPPHLIKKGAVIRIY